MPKRQEKPYAAQVAAMSKPKLKNEIKRLIGLGLSGEDTDEQLRICSAEDNKRDSGCYEAAMVDINASLGFRQTGPRDFDIRKSTQQPVGI